MDLYTPMSQGTSGTLYCPEDASAELLLHTSVLDERHFRSLTLLILNPKLLTVIYLHVRTLAPRNHERNAGAKRRIPREIDESNARVPRKQPGLSLSRGYHCAVVDIDSRNHEAYNKKP